MADDKKQSQQQTAEEQQIEMMRGFAALSVVARNAFKSRLGQSHDNERDVYEALGWKKALSYDDYGSMYRRGGIGKAVIRRPVDATWRGETTLEDPTGEDSAFLRDWQELENRIKPWHYFKRVDRLACLGRYSVLLIGFNDEEDFNREVQPSAGLTVNYLSVFGEGSITISETEDDSSSPRFGLPKVYKLQNGKSSSITAHRTRVVHVAHDLEESDVEGTPLMEGCYNYLQALQLVSGVTGEMFWEQAIPGIALNLDKDVDLTDDQKSGLNDEIQNFYHKQQKFMRLQGIDVKRLDPKISDPSNPGGFLVDLIAATQEIPKRILMGSERGELASTQDERAWDEKISERRTDYAEDVIVFPFVDRLVELGVLTDPGTDGYAVYWPPLNKTDEKTRTEIGKARTDMLMKYVNTDGIERLIAPDDFLQYMVGFEPERVDAMLEKVQNLLGAVGEPPAAETGEGGE